MSSHISCDSLSWFKSQCHLVYFEQIVKSHLGTSIQYILTSNFQWTWPVEWENYYKYYYSFSGNEKYMDDYFYKWLKRLEEKGVFREK